MEFYPFVAHRIALEYRASDMRLQMKHNLRQEKLYSTVTLHSDQQTHGIAPECEFTDQAFKTSKVNLSGISLKRETNQNFITFLKL